MAAPSWVRPGTLAENCCWLSGKVDEAGLLFFESESCLAYTAADLPPDLAALPLKWHVHLPTDLDWSKPEKAAEICLELMRKVSSLDVRRAVLHPPSAGTAGNLLTDGLARLTCFLRAWTRAGLDSRDILLENLPEHDFIMLAAAAESLSCSLCLDLEHLLANAARQKGVPDARRITASLRLVRMLHLCAPGPLRADASRGGHAPLEALAPKERELARRICRQAPPETVFMLELFNWEAIERSLPLLRSWLEEGTGVKAQDRDV